MSHQLKSLFFVKEFIVNPTEKVKIFLYMHYITTLKRIFWGKLRTMELFYSDDDSIEYTF